MPFKTSWIWFWFWFFSLLVHTIENGICLKKSNLIETDPSSQPGSLFLHKNYSNKWKWSYGVAFFPILLNVFLSTFISPSHFIFQFFFTIFNRLTSFVRLSIRNLRIDRDGRRHKPENTICYFINRSKARSKEFAHSLQNMTKCMKPT